MLELRNSKMHFRLLQILLLVTLLVGTGLFAHSEHQRVRANEALKNVPMEMNGFFHRVRSKKKSDPFFCRFTWQYTMGPYLGGCQYMGNPPNKWLCDIEELCTFTGCYQLCKWVCDDPMVLASCNYPNGSHFDCVITNEGAGCNPE